MKLLIVEDDRATRLLLSKLAKKWGYDVTAVEDGVAAWEIMQQDDAPSLLLLDWEMPRMSGIELCMRIRERNDEISPYIILLTGRAYIDDIVEALDKGVNDYMLKPINKDELHLRLTLGVRKLQTGTECKSVSNIDSSADHYKALFDESADAFLLYKDGKYIDCNHAAVKMLGCKDKAEVLNTAPLAFSARQQADGSLSTEKAKKVTSLALTQGSLRFEWNHKRKCGEVFPVEVLLTAVPIGDERGLHLAWRDLSEHKTKQKELKRLAHYDVLTQLPNRALFSDRFNQAVAHSKRTKTLLAVCFLDLDDFKPINDNHGHHIGDKILIEVSERIKLSLREGDTVSRQGGDEFTLLLGGLEHHDQAKQILDRMLHSLSEPYLVGDVSHAITASCGASISPKEPMKLEDLLFQADTAMYEAKQSGKNHSRFYDHSLA